MLKSHKIIMDDDNLIGWESISLVIFSGHEWVEYPFGMIVRVSCCLSCKVVLEEVVESRR